MTKKLFAVLLALVMLFGTTSTVAAVGTIAPAADMPAYNGNVNYQYGGPVDLNIADEDKIIEMLKKEGKIDPNATIEEAHQKFIEYMQMGAQANMNEKPSKIARDIKARQNQKVQKYKFDPRTTDANPMKVNVLVLLVEYSDFAHNNIQPDETGMYYKDYNHEHFQNMIFGENGYKGPNGENFVSMRQYYKEQSGGSLEIDGAVAGWYKLPNTAAFYGEEKGSSHDVSPRTAVKDALKLAAQDPNLNLADFDKISIVDWDEDGDYNEPDGIIDYLMILHAGVGQEAGGGRLGSNAIWSHSWNLGGISLIPNTTSDIAQMRGMMGAFAYTIEPEDGAAGVFVHEFGHNLGLPDEYDTQYTSALGEPISMWSVMSSGSWAGTIPGTEPPGFSPYGKTIFQGLYGGNWQKAISINYEDITNAGVRVTLKQASEEGQVVKINLPGKSQDLGLDPFNGQYSYWSGSGNDLDNYMYTAVEVPSAADVKMTFKAWYQIEQDWDYASVIVREAGADHWGTVAGNITTTTSPYGQNPGNGITGSSNGVVDATFDLTAYAGKNIEIGFNYWTDGAAAEKGLMVDDIAITADGAVVFEDGGEADDVFTYEGFIKTDGTYTTPHYYLVEWRNHHGVDKGLAHIGVLGKSYAYQPGMIIWYVDEAYGDNWVGNHPGEGYLGIVDADQNNIVWKWADGRNPYFASNRYQMTDAAFSKNKENAVVVNLDEELGRSAIDNNCYTEPNFDDSRDYSNPEIPTLGKKLPQYGIKIQITNQAKDNSQASITIKK